MRRSNRFSDESRAHDLCYRYMQPVEDTIVSYLHMVLQMHCGTYEGLYLMPDDIVVIPGSCHYLNCSNSCT